MNSPSPPREHPMISPLTIGWRERVDLPDWHLRGVKAKIDTGANTSAIDVAQIEDLPNGDIRFEVVYRIKPERRTKWVRATHGGFLGFHVAPSDIVDQDAPIATNTDLVGEEQNIIRAPRDGIILGMTTIPSVAPGDPVCHLAFPKKSQLRRIENLVEDLHEDTLHERIREDLARGIFVTGFETLLDRKTRTNPASAKVRSPQ